MLGPYQDKQPLKVTMQDQEDTLINRLGRDLVDKIDAEIFRRKYMEAEKTKEPSYIIIGEKWPTYRWRHAGYEQAHKEAMKLADEYPGISIRLFREIESVKTRIETEIERY